MSFILDALKKSESDRQRQSGPALYEVRVAPPRSGLPLWAVAIAALLAINLGIVVWMLLRPPAHESAAPAAAAVPTPAPAAASAPAPAPAPAAPTAAPAAASAAGGAVPGTGAPPAGTVAPLVNLQPPPAPVSAGTGAEEPQNPQDYAPAQDTSPGSHVRRTSAAGVPLYQDAAVTPGTQIPQLHLDFHMYAPQPQDRFVMINMHKLREGESLPEGVHVNAITPEGVVLSYNGQTFMLPRE